MLGHLLLTRSLPVRLLVLLPWWAQLVKRRRLQQRLLALCSRTLRKDCFEHPPRAGCFHLCSRTVRKDCVHCRR